MKDKRRKKHYFASCSGFGWQETDVERQKYLAHLMCEVTCMTCKLKIVAVIAEKDWNEVDRRMYAELLAAANEVVCRNS